MCLFGLLHERINANKAPEEVQWEAFIFGCVSGLVPWICIVAYMLMGKPSLIPGFVWAILGVYAILFCTFPINMILQYRRTGWWANKDFENSGYFFGCVVGDGGRKPGRLGAPDSFLTPPPPPPLVSVKRFTAC